MSRSEFPTEQSREREACLAADECGPNWPYIWTIELSFCSVQNLFENQCP